MRNCRQCQIARGYLLYYYYIIKVICKTASGKLLRHRSRIFSTSKYSTRCWTRDDRSRRLTKFALFLLSPASATLSRYASEAHVLGGMIFVTRPIFLRPLLSFHLFWQSLSFSVFCHIILSKKYSPFISHFVLFMEDILVWFIENRPSNLNFFWICWLPDF